MKAASLASLIALCTTSVSFAGTPSAKQPALAPVEEVRRAIVYDYVEGGYTGIIPDAGSDLHGGYIEASFSPVSNLFIFGRGAVMGGNDTVVDLALGIGGYVPLVKSSAAPTVDLTLRTGWNFTSFDGGGDINTWFVAPGLRALLSESLEINAQGFYYIPDEGDDGIAVGGGLVYYLNRNLALTASYSFDFEDDSHFVQAGVRYMW